MLSHNIYSKNDTNIERAILYAVVLPYTVLSTVPSYEGRIYSMQLHARCEDMQGILIYKKVGS
jgi:hypothetical protein